MKKNLLHIDEIRFLIIHLILINHWTVSIWVAQTPVNIRLVNWWIELTSPTLALISGYLFFYRTQQGLHFGKKVQTRFFSLVIPYVIWTWGFYIIYLILKSVYSRFFHDSAWYAETEPFGIQGLMHNLVHPPLINFWYLQNLILVVPFNILIYQVIRQRYVFVAVLALVILNYAYGWINLFFDSRFLPYYLIGCFFGYQEKYLPKVKMPNWLLIAAVPVVLVFSATVGSMPYTLVWSILVKIALVFLFVFVVFNLLDALPQSWLFRYLEKYKAHSFFLFGINMFLFTIIQRLLMKAGAARHFDNGWFVLAFCIATTILVLIWALSMGTWLKKHAPRFYSVIIGR